MMSRDDRQSTNTIPDGSLVPSGGTVDDRQATGGERQSNAADVRLNIAAVIVVTGLYIVTLSALADVLGFGSDDGFGQQQYAGLALACVLCLTGAMLRVPTLFVIGLITGLMTLFADWLGFGSSEGFGIQQQLGVGLGAVLLAVGARIALRR